MPDQDTTERSAAYNEIEASIRANRYARSVLDPAKSPEVVRKRYLAEAGQYWAVTGSEDTDLSELRLLELYRTHVAQC